MPIKTLWLISRLPVDFCPLEQLSIAILSAGDLKPHSSIAALTAGSLKWLILKKIWLRKTKRLTGYLHSCKINASTTGLLTRRIGVSQETDTGATQFQSGPLKMVRKLFVYLRLSSLKNYQVSPVLQTSIVNLSTTSPSLRSKVKAFYAESLKSLIVGLNLEPCHSLRAITHFQLTTNSSWRDSQQTSLRKVLIKLEVGSTLWW